MTTQVLTASEIVERASFEGVPPQYAALWRDACRWAEAQVLAKLQAQQPQAEPFGQVTVVRKPGCADMHWFYRWPDPPYLDNAAECHTVYTQQPQAAGVPEGWRTIVKHACDLLSTEVESWKASHTHPTSGEIDEPSVKELIDDYEDTIKALGELIATTPHPATAQPTPSADDVRDAERWRTLRDSLHPVNKSHTSMPRLSYPFNDGLTYTAHSLVRSVDAIIEERAALSQQAKEV